MGCLSIETGCLVETGWLVVLGTGETDRFVFCRSSVSGGTTSLRLLSSPEDKLTVDEPNVDCDS